MTGAARSIPPVAKSGPAPLFILAAVVLGWSVLAAATRSYLYEWEAVAASALLLAGCVGALLWRASEQMMPLRAIAALACAQSFQAAGLPLLNRARVDDLLFNATAAAFTSNVVATTAFTFSFLAAVAMGLKVLPNTFGGADQITKPDVRRRELRSWVALLFVLFIPANAFLGADSGLARLGTLPLVVLNQNWIIPVATMAAVSGSRASRATVMAAVGMATVVAAWSTMLGSLMAPLRAILLTLILLRRRAVALFVALAAMGFLVVQPAKSLVREETSLYGPPTNAAETIDRWQRAIAKTWTGNADVEENLTVGARRLDYNTAGAAVFASVPTLAPFKDGATYAEIPYMLIPRVLLPEKEASGGFRAKLTVEIGAQSADSTETTAVALPAPAEAFWNFGWAGVVGVAALLGAATAALFRLAPTDPVTKTGFIILVAISMSAHNDLLFTIVPQIAYVLAARVLIPSLTQAAVSDANVEATPTDARAANAYPSAANVNS